MKEFDKDIHPDSLHGVVYPSVVKREMIGQFDLEGGILFMANSERYPVIDSPCEEAKPARSPLQGEFLFTRPIRFVGLKLANVSRGTRR